MRTQGLLPRWKRYGWGLFFLALLLALAGCRSQVEEPNQPPVWSRVRDMERLTTVEYELSTVVQIEKPRTAVHAATENLVWGVCGRVTAGIDLSKIAEDAIREDQEGRLVVTLPQAKVFNVELELATDDATQQRSVEMEKWTVDVQPVCEQPITWDTPKGLSRSEDLIQIAHDEATKAFRRTAEESGILEEAQREAERQLRQFFQLSGYEDVVFEYAESPASDEATEAN